MIFELFSLVLESLLFFIASTCLCGCVAMVANLVVCMPTGLLHKFIDWKKKFRSWNFFILFFFLLFFVFLVCFIRLFNHSFFVRVLEKNKIETRVVFICTSGLEMKRLDHIQVPAPSTLTLELDSSLYLELDWAALRLRRFFIVFTRVTHTCDIAFALLFLLWSTYAFGLEACITLVLSFYSFLLHCERVRFVNGHQWNRRTISSYH